MKSYWMIGDIHNCGERLFTDGKDVYCEKCGKVGVYKDVPYRDIYWETQADRPPHKFSNAIRCF